ncbi:MAG: PIG-L family deacetylase [Actinomycetota bacterium]|nr:PIG-L family deacetylase [Actinomycetota bacterium]
MGPLTLPACDHAVVVAPHPDDEVLGAGGLLQVLTDRSVPVDVCAVSDGEASWGPLDAVAADQLRQVRTAESEAALIRLGVEPTRRDRLRLIDGRIADGQGVLTAWLHEHVTPTSLVIAPWTGDGHPDHDVTGAVCRRVAAEAEASSLHYLVWAWHWATPDGTDVPWRSCRTLALTRRQAARKRWATGAFRSQTGVPLTLSDGLAVLPPPVLRRFWRTWEVYVT